MGNQQKSGKFDCKDIAKYLYQYLDGELEQSPAKLFKEHLEYCIPCDKKVEFETKLKEIICQKSKEQTTPDSLKQKINKFLNDFDL